MSNFVFVLDTNKQPLNPVHPGQARRLLSLGKAAVYKRFPFTIILKQAVEQNPPSKGVTLKIDPGSKTTGIALIQENKVIWGAELTYRAYTISKSLYKRAGVRRSRRHRKTPLSEV